MLSETMLDRIPVWLLYVAIVVVLMAGKEIGYRVGLRRRATLDEGKRTPANAIVGSILGLLAFMLAFTFGMAGSRFDARRQLVLDEASAVLRAHQRAGVLPSPQREACTGLLKEYVALRVSIAEMKRIEDIDEAVRRSESIQDALWAEVGALAHQPTAILAGFILSLSELSDLQMKRVRAAVWNRIPPSIMMTLCGVAFLAMTAMGYGAGLAESRTTIPILMLILAFSAIIILIVDLERPRQQLFKVNQEPMAEVARRLQ